MNNIKTGWSRKETQDSYRCSASSLRTILVSRIN